MKKKSNKIPFLSTVSPAIIWLILFLVLPLLYIVGISFMKKGLYGGVIQTFDLTAYKTMFQSKYMKILLDSLWLSLKTTGLCLLFGYPFAYIISNTKKKWKPFCVLLIMLPFWINSLIRTYGWNSILREQGILNTLLMQLGIIKQPLQMLYTDGAVLLGMVYALIRCCRCILPLKSWTIPFWRRPAIWGHPRYMCSEKSYFLSRCPGFLRHRFRPSFRLWDTSLSRI